MASTPLRLDPVFLSASVPDPARDKKYFETGDSIAIRDAVIALVTVVLPRTRLVFGGHPAIAPMVKWVADGVHAFERVRMFQSTYYRDRYIKDISFFRYKEIEAESGGEEPSLKKMREAMLSSEKSFSGAFFIGGMEGVEKEYDLIKNLKPDVPRFPVATTGAAARSLWMRERDLVPHMPPDLQVLRNLQLEELKTKISYLALFTKLLDLHDKTSST